MLGYSCSLWCRQFWLILLKNFILQIRRPIGTIFELLLPCLAVVVIIALRYTLFQPKERCFATFSTYDLSYPEMYVFYTPNTIQSLEVVSRANVLLPNAVFVGVDSEDGILQEIAQLDKGDHPRYAGVILPNNLEQSFHNILITIRETHEVGGSHSWFTVRQTAIFRGFSPRRGNTYYRHGFLHLQNAISFGLTQWKLNSSGVSIDPPVVKIRQMAFPTYTSDIFLEGIVLALPVLLVLGYLYSAGVFTQELVLEKESRLRESMKMMGLKPSALFSAWFVKQFLFLMITGIVVSLLIKFGGILPKSDFFLLLLFVLLFLFSLISYGFFMSSFFSSSRVSLFSAFLVWFLILFPYLVLALSYSELSLGVKMATCLFSNTCAGFAVNFISSLEIHGEGMNWSNAFQPSTIEDPFHLGVVFGMLLLDSVLYLVFAWYKQAVFPGKYGVPKPFYFPFLPSYWLGRPLRKKSVFPSATNELADLRMEANNFEQEPVGLNCGIKIRNMTKIYQRCCRKQKVAVNDLSLNMYEGQITALLGHNGAGKTTTMSVLTGLYTPTSGDAIINRYSILTDMDEIRKNLGLCPQHNVLFERLTVKEHLMLFGMLKGAMGKSLYDDVKLMISDLQLDDKRNVAVKKLSGGMKRKLSVGIALIGGSKFVILDEPTSGMDPYARRSTWDLLGKYKKNRTILLTTHHMDEADILGDRIAIMAEGKLLTSGSSLFLKSRFGVGYHLTMVKGRDTSSDRICEVVTSTIDGAEMVCWRKSLSGSSC